MIYAVCFLAFVAAAHGLVSDEDVLARIRQEQLAKFEPGYNQKFEANECTEQLSNPDTRKGPASYLLWAQKQKSNPLIQGCTCKETVAITNAVRHSKQLDLVSDFPHIWRAFCEGKEDPITDQAKFELVLTELKKHGSEHILEFAKWGEEIIRGYLKSLSLTDEKWGIAFVFGEIEARTEDEALVSTMEFCYVLDIKKDVYTKIAEDKNNNPSEQRFIRYFVDLAREDPALVAFLKSDQTKIASIVNNAASLFTIENSEDQNSFKKEVDKFVKAFFSPEKTKSGPWQIEYLSGALAKYCKAPYDDDTAIEMFKSEKLEDVKTFVQQTPNHWC